MSPLLLAICIALCALQFRLTRAWAFLPLLVAPGHTPYIPFLGGLTVARAVIICGLLRAGMNGWLSWSFRNSLDRLVVIFAVIVLFSTVGHSSEHNNPLMARLRLVVDVVGTFLYMRAYLTDRESLGRLSSALALVLVPFALLMAMEKQSGMNPYAAIGAGNLFSLIREGEFRAQGPFGTPILAGTVGACAIPLFIALLKTRRKLAITGIVAGMVIVLSSASSGPLSTLAIGLAVVAFWKWRVNFKAAIIGVILLLLGMQMFKDRPIWYLMALMDLVGGSTGWHRAYLIDMAVQHLDEWWLLGTGFTRHWMPYGLAAVPEHCDLTNYYIHLGVMSGLGVIICLMTIQWRSFRMLSERMRELRGSDPDAEFGLWCVMAIFIAHAITFLSISYFDQVYVFFWGLLGGLPGFLQPSENEDEEDDEDEEMSPADYHPPEWGRGQAAARSGGEGFGTFG